MYPVLFHLGGLTVYSYGFFALLAMVSGALLTYRLARTCDADRQVVLTFAILALPLGVLGGKLMTVASDPAFYLANPGKLLSVVLSQSAGVAYGGILADSLFLFLLCRFHGRPFGVVGDMCAVGLALGHTIWRIGCFLAGCCYGRAATVPWAVVFSDPLASKLNGTPLGVGLHPTQLYEAAAVAAILVALVWLRARRLPPGSIGLAYFALYGAVRFALEPFRGDDRGVHAGGWLSTSQLISLAILAVVVPWILRSWSRRNEVAPRA